MEFDVVKHIEGASDMSVGPTKENGYQAQGLLIKKKSRRMA